MNKEEANPVQTKRFSERKQEQPLKKSVKKKIKKKKQEGIKRCKEEKSGGKRNVVQERRNKPRVQKRQVKEAVRLNKMVKRRTK